MQLKKFSINNYKSIKSVEGCWLADDITILAGKNESGKSTILEAIRDFGDNNKNLEDCKSINSEENPSIILYFKLNDEDVSYILENLDYSSEKLESLLTKEILGLRKNSNSSITFDDSTLLKISQLLYSEAESQINEIILMIKKLNENPEVKITFDDKEIKKNRRINNTCKTLTEHLSKLELIKDSIISDKDGFNGSLSKIRTELTKLYIYKLDNVSNLVIENIPKIVFFSSFEAKLPYKIEITTAKQNPSVSDFMKVANIPYDKLVKTTDTKERANLLGKCNARISGDFKDFWKQNTVEINARADGAELVFALKEDGNISEFKPEHRSQGFQWFLNFYLRLKAEGSDNSECIILIDEPGLYLHADAQKYVLKVLEELSNENRAQIIFSTHSPYLLDADKLSRIKLVTKHNGETHVENKIHKKADTETLTPIITSIGYSLASDITFSNNSNAIVEGITDYYYISGINRLLSEKDKISAKIIPCVGATNIQNLVSIFHGWGLEYLAILDNEPKGREVARSLKKSLIEDKRIIFISDVEGDSIEDLFTTEDFNSFILPEDSQKNDGNIKNSKFIKNKLDSAMLAKSFFELCLKKDKVKLSNTTLDNFRKLFSKIDNILNKNIKAANAA